MNCVPHYPPLATAHLWPLSPAPAAVSTAWWLVIVTLTTLWHIRQDPSSLGKVYLTHTGTLNTLLEILMLVNEGKLQFKHQEHKSLTWFLSAPSEFLRLSKFHCCTVSQFEVRSQRSCGAQSLFLQKLPASLLFVNLSIIQCYVLR